MNNHFGVVVIFFTLLGAGSAFSDTARDAAIDAQVFAPATDGSLTDGRAVVQRLEGRAVIIKSGSPVEADLKVGDPVQIGDTVYTEKGAKLSISFDSKVLNAVRIPADTKAVFTSIEPTDIKLENGTIFNAVDGLVKGSSWKVTTPAAVAAVRGTHFEVSYDAASGEFSAATFKDWNDEKLSAVEIMPMGGGEIVEVIEGRELGFDGGQMPAQELVQELRPEIQEKGEQQMKEVVEQRSESSSAEGGDSKGQGGPNGPGGGSAGVSDSQGGNPGKGPDGPGGLGDIINREPLISEFRDPFPVDPDIRPDRPIRPDPLIDDKRHFEKDGFPKCGSPGHNYGAPCTQ